VFAADQERVLFPADAVGVRRWHRRAQRHTCRSISGRSCGTRSTTTSSATLSLSPSDCSPSTTATPTRGISLASVSFVQVVRLLPTMSPAAAAISAVPTFLPRAVGSWPSTEKASWPLRTVFPNFQTSGPLVRLADYFLERPTDLFYLR
jgi:hypothetical protein